MAPDPTSPTAPLVDLRAPLLPQVAGLGDRYDGWVHRSIKPGRRLRVFRSDFLESFTTVRWPLVLAVWSPVAVAVALLATLWQGVPAGPAAGLFVAGVALWTLVEYVLHRFVFHHRFRSAAGRRFHFLVHGIHHLDPWDPERLVFPPLPGAVVAGLLFLGLRLALPLGPALAVMSGLLAGYLAYDLTHYYTHHAQPRSRWGKFLKRYHLEHHHRHPYAMYGVSQPLWDLVLRTGRPRRDQQGRSAGSTPGP